MKTGLLRVKCVIWVVKFQALGLTQSQMKTNSLVNASFGSRKKLSKLIVKNEEKIALVKDFLFHSTC